MSARTPRPDKPIIFHDAPRHLTPAALKGREFEPIILTGIVNPFGPTLSCAALIMPKGLDPSPRVVLVTLNPFSQEYLELGFVARESINCFSRIDFEPIVRKLLVRCPTIIIPGQCMTRAQRLLIGPALAQDREELSRQYAALMRYPNNPWERVKEEMSGAFTKQRAPNLFSKIAKTLRGARVHEEGLELGGKFRAAVAAPEAFEEEFAAFLYAWKGAIDFNKSNGGNLPSLSADEMLAIVTPLLKKCDLPSPLEAVVGKPPESEQQQVNKPKNPSVVASVETGKKEFHWEVLDESEFVEFFASELLLYGVMRDQDTIPKLKNLYPSAISRISKEIRLEIINEIAAAVERGHSSALAFLPSVICDPDTSVASTATINLLSTSELMATGLPYGLMELYHLFENKGIVNAGAVFGAVVAYGDERIRISLDILKVHLNEDEVRAAARISTGLVTNSAMDFWLSWAEELVGDRDAFSLDALGSIASALVLARRNCIRLAVFDIERSYPAHTSEEPIRILKQTEWDEYAAYVAQRLYDLEERERAPKIFSYVLQSWGLRPRAREEDQYKLDLS